MQFSFALLALAAASSALAQTAGFDVVTKPDPSKPGSETLTAGKPYTINWTPSTVAPLNGKINIVLLQGKTNITLQAGDTIATEIDGSKGTFTWDVPTSTPVFPTYGFEFVLVSDPKTIQYSTFFSISGLSAGSDSPASGSASGSATGSASSTAVTTVPSTTITSTATSSSSSSATGVTYSNSTTTSHAASTTTGASGSGSGTSSTKPSTTSQSANAAPTMMSGSGLAGAVVIAFGLLL